MNKFYWFIGIILLFSISCDDDSFNFVNEPLVFFEHPGTLTYNRVYGIGGNGDINPLDEVNTYQLPLNLNKDTTAYIFERNSGKDTLTVSYIRELNPYSGCENRFSMSIYNVNLVFENSTFDPNEIQLYLLPHD